MLQSTAMNNNNNIQKLNHMIETLSHATLLPLLLGEERCVTKQKRLGGKLH